eukprot:SAG25_NODE_1162_length_3720_cov_739.361502_4_plen_80_part_00
MKDIRTSYIGTNLPAPTREAYRDGIQPIVAPRLTRPMKRINIAKIPLMRLHQPKELGHRQLRHYGCKRIIEHKNARGRS